MFENISHFELRQNVMVKMCVLSTRNGSRKTNFFLISFSTWTIALMFITVQIDENQSISTAVVAQLKTHRRHKKVKLSVYVRLNEMYKQSPRFRLVSDETAETADVWPLLDWYQIFGRGKKHKHCSQVGVCSRKPFVAQTLWNAHRFYLESVTALSAPALH